MSWTYAYVAFGLLGLKARQQTFELSQTSSHADQHGSVVRAIAASYGNGELLPFVEQKSLNL